METRVRVSFRPSNNTETFGTFSLSFTDPQSIEHSTELKFDPKDIWSFSGDVESVAFDFLILAFLVYNADRAINRILNSVDGWKRNIVLEGVPCNNLHEMNQAKVSFQDAINFLTGDEWDITFVKFQEFDYSPTKHIVRYNHSEYVKVALFSGGLDSLIGFIDEASLLEDGEKIVLVSHMELGKEHSDQQGILDYCKSRGIFSDRYSQVLLNAGLKQNTWSSPTKAEGTFRSRSILFFAAGIYIAHSLNPTMPLIVPENGTISVNVPLDRGRRSSCSTRTTHPTFIKKLESALRIVGINNSIINPYAFMSKADMMEKCCEDPTKKDILMALTPLSCSCAKRGHNSFWDKSGSLIKQRHITHCGMCLPCLYRRVALDSVGCDNGEIFGTDVFHGSKYNLDNKQQRRNRDFNALLRFIRNNANEEYIRRELRINGILESDNLNSYVDLAIHSYEQVKEWIRKNGSLHIRNIAGIS